MNSCLASPSLAVDHAGAISATSVCSRSAELLYDLYEPSGARRPRAGNRTVWCTERARARSGAALRTGAPRPPPPASDGDSDISSVAGPLPIFMRPAPTSKLVAVEGDRLAPALLVNPSEP
jgi:hypothetical protein